MLPPVFNTLQASAPVVALLGSRIYRHGSAPKGVTQPYATWFQVNGDPQNTLSETPSMDRSTIQVDIWCGGADGDSKCERAAEAVRDAIEPVAHCIGTPIDQRDQETQLWRMALEFDWFVPRPFTPAAS